MKVSILNFNVPENLCIKNPTSSNLGKMIVFEGLNLMYEIGLEDFTFKKLALKIASTESTIYRYFESKNQFLFYLFNYYWSWMEYRLILATTNIEDSEEKLRRVIKTLSKTVEDDIDTPFINEHKLQQVIMVEYSKTFLNIKVEGENKSGYFKQYKQLVDQLSKIILEINPNYPYPNALITTIIESSFHQRFFSKHLPKLTNNIATDQQLEKFLLILSFGAIQKQK